MHLSVNTWSVKLFKPPEEEVKALGLEAPPTPAPANVRQQWAQISVPASTDDRVMNVSKDVSERREIHVGLSTRNSMLEKELQVRIHGAAQLAIYQKDQGEWIFRRAFEPVELVRRLIETMDEEVTGSELTARRELIRKARNLVRRFEGLRLTHFVLMNGMALLLGYFCFSTLIARDRIAAVHADKQAEGGTSLCERIFVNGAIPGDGKNRGRVILVAASGGGTRAALFTASGLAGLQRANVLDEVQLVSGVSGGGAAVGYFAAHREELLKEAESDAWQHFDNAMANDYIIDVLRGAPEYRISSNIDRKTAG